MDKVSFQQNFNPAKLTTPEKEKKYLTRE